MKKLFLKQRLQILIFLFIVTLFVACTTIRGDSSQDRSTPEVRTDVPITSSEIREIKFKKELSEAGHTDMHLKGQLYTKSIINGQTQISPCSGCVISLTSPTETTFSANMTTQSDGSFELHAKALPLKLTLNHTGLNPLIIENFVPMSGGMINIKIITAKGSTPEFFRVAKTGDTYTWSKVQ
jgi:hypothetical protein